MNIPETIVLMGAPGAGKSTVGPKLARRLEKDFIDVDVVIEQREGEPIPEIFLTRGEPAFREIERQVTLELIQQPGVISLGGGAIMNDEVRAALKDVHVVWLQVDAAHASRRVGLNGNDRPLLAGGVHSAMVKLLNQRLPRYGEVATQRVDTNQLRASAVVRLVLAGFGIDEPEDA